MPEQNGDVNAILNHLKGIVIRRKWWISIITCLVSLVTIRLSYLLPDHYRSEAIIFMANARVSEQYVVPNNRMNTMEAIDAVTRGVLSRARLLQIIDEYNLYPTQRQIGPAALGALMRNDIEVLPLSKNPERRPMNAFLIAFTATDPATAQKVTQRLASLFIEENQQAQQDIDAGTTSFLEGQLETARADIDRQAASLQAFKMRNLGQLPQQQADNLQALSGLQFQLQSAQSDLSRARQQHAYLLAMLSQYGSSSEAQGSEPDSAGSNSLASLQQDLARLHHERDELLARYSPLYPDVVSIDHRIAEEEAKLSQLANAPKTPTKNNSETSASGSFRYPADPAAVQLRSQLQANEMEIQDAQSQALRLNAQISTYNQRLVNIPVREQQLEELQRTYELSKQNYADLLNKVTQSDLATKLAAQQSSQRFQIIDQASLPFKPSGPQRQKIALGGLAGGLVAGLAFAFLVEMHDRSFHVESEVRAYLPIPLIIGIPPLLTQKDQHRRALRNTLSWVAEGLMLFVLVVAQLYVYRNG